MYDLLNKESKRLGLNKYQVRISVISIILFLAYNDKNISEFQGYSDAVLYELINSSKDTSAYQLKFILSKIVDRQDTRDTKITMKIKELVKDIDQKDSYINLATKYIPPLVFAP